MEISPGHLTQSHFHHHVSLSLHDTAQHPWLLKGLLVSARLPSQTASYLIVSGPSSNHAIGTPSLTRHARAEGAIAVGICAPLRRFVIGLSLQSAMCDLCNTR